MPSNVGYITFVRNDTAVGLVHKDKHFFVIVNQLI